MTLYQTKSNKLTGTSLKEVKKKVQTLYKEIASGSRKGKVYVRAAYFRKEKVFFDYFWQHTFQKSPKERFERLKFFKASVELIKNSRNQPASKINPNNRREILHRFAGVTQNKELFFVQVKEDTKTKQKYFMSCFSPE